MHEAAPTSPIIRLEENRKRLIAHFLEGKEPDFFQRHAESIDDYFREAFASSSVGPLLRVDKNPYAIVALGGYGRKEQHIHSDVDVLLLFEKRIPEKARELVQEIFYPLWDTGLEVGHATRSIKECCALASRDYEVLTSLLDGRFICGISSLYSDLMERLRKKVLTQHGQTFLNWLSEKNRQRHDRFGDSTYLLEPNLKEGQGGLRDFHTTLWAARVVYGITEPRDLEFMGHLTHDEFQTLDKALPFIREVRNWLHYETGRKCDQLYFEYQIRLAKALGFQEKSGQKAVERFLSQLHRQMEFVKRQHLIFLEKTLNAKKRWGKTGARRTLSAGLELADGVLHFEAPEAILENPKLLIKIFEKSALIQKPLCNNASRLVREFLYLIDEPFRRSASVIKSFKHILSAPTYSFNVLYEMLNTGILVALVPEMEIIVDRIQYDEYHLYPVDKHCLRTVQALKELRDVDADSHDAFYAEVFREVRNPEILLWAGLFHDIGKGETDNGLEGHGENGARIVKGIFERMDFPQDEIDTIMYLVCEHLFLIHTATRRDIHDEKIIVQCARKIGNEDRLRMLYLLTVADSRATGPKAWNEWKAALLKELFFKIYHILKEGDLGSPASDIIVESKKAKVFASADFMPRPEMEALFDNLSPRYLLYTPAEEIVSHMRLFTSLDKQPCTLKAEVEPQTNLRIITICARDFPGLFSNIAGVFTLHGLNILSAQIYTWRNHIALDVFKVEAPADALHEKEKWEKVDAALKAVLNGGLSLTEALKERLAGYKTCRRMPKGEDRVVVDIQTSDFFSIVEIYTHDCPGLLYRITDTLFKCGLDIWVAMIGTKVDQVVDVFYVRDFNGQKITSDEQIASIKKAVLQVLSENGEENKTAVG